MTLVTAPETEPIDRSLPAEILADPLPEALKPANIGSSETPALRYDPIAIEAHYRRRPFQVLGRLWAIAMPFALFALNLWWDQRTGQTIEKQPKRAEQVRKIVTKLGPAFIKIGQALSTRPDLVPPSYLEELTKLQDQLPPFPNEIAFRFIEEELGDRPENIYAELSPMPIAAASLGQVYKGKLKTGETVAIKVQRPGLAQLIALDIYILRRLSRWATNTFKQIRSDLVGITDEFAGRIFEEMDYTQEGHNAERFAQLYGHLQDVYVPRIYWEYTARRVLTMEWITGVKLTQLDQIRAMGIDATDLINVGVQCSLRQLLEHGFFHADPHPGNLLAMPDGKLAYLDFGMMSEIKPYQRYGLIESIVHLVNRDFEGLAKDYVKLEFLTPDTDLTPIVPAFAAVFNDALSASVAEINIKSMTDQLSALMYEYPFRVPAYYALIIRSLVTLEGIAINADPDFKVLSQAYPYVAKRLLTDQSPELRDSLRDLLFKDGSFRWNRLENLLKNASGSEEYDMSLVADQTLEFLFSDRGQFIREYLVSEVVKAIDVYSRLAIENATHTFWGWLGLQSPVNTPTVSPEERKNLDHLLRIIDILRGTRGFDPMQFASVLPRILAKPETQQMGQKIAAGLAQRAIARFVREVILREPDRSVYVPVPPSAGQRSLPVGN